MLSLSEIRRRAVEFVQAWKDESSEDAEAKTFWDAFFQVFGQNRRQIARYEKLVMKAGSKAGFIDLFWPSVCMVENKSRCEVQDHHLSPEKRVSLRQVY